MAEDRDRDQEHDWEALKLYFEFFKHFTTLATAVALIVLAMFRGFDLSTKAAVFGLSMMGATLFLSLIGMLTAVVRADKHAPLGVRPGYPTSLLVVLVVSLFFVGVLTFTSLARGFELTMPVPF